MSGMRVCAGAGLKEVEGRRQSTRVKMAPLRWYCNEHYNYERTHKSAPPLPAHVTHC
jgi:hypothetical protein